MTYEYYYVSQFDLFIKQNTLYEIDDIYVITKTINFNPLENMNDKLIFYYDDLDQEKLNRKLEKIDQYKKLKKIKIDNKIFIQTNILSNLYSYYVENPLDIKYQIQELLIKNDTDENKINEIINLNTNTNSHLKRKITKLLNLYINYLLSIESEKNQIRKKVITKISEITIIENQINESKKYFRNQNEFYDNNNWIIRHVKTIKPEIDSLRKKYQEEKIEYGECIISMNDFIDAMSDGSFFCILIKTSKEKTNKILDIGISLITEKYFQQTEIIDITNKTMNNIFPLYICEEHWNIAKYKVKELFGIIHKNDKYKFQQKYLKKITFEMLDFICHEKYNNYKIKNWIRKTCLKIQTDFINV